MSVSAVSLRRTARTTPGAGIVDRRLGELDAEVERRNRPPLWRRLLSLAFTAVIVAGTIWLWPDRLGGATNFVVVRGTSMEPVYHLNDVVVARAEDEYQIGDIVVFSIPDGAGQGSLVIHRLTGKRDDGTWITQGDNRDTPDDFRLEDSDLRGAPVFVLPRAGRLLALVSNTFVVATAFGLFAVVLLWPKRKPEEPVLVASYTEGGRSEPEPLPDPFELPVDLPITGPVTSPSVDALVAALHAETAALDHDDAVAAEAEEWLAAELERLGLEV